MDDRSILVVDDDLAIRETVSQILEFEGYSVRTAANGLEALRVLDQERPALILLDMRMPICNGWDLARALDRRGARPPILVMTAAQSARHWAAEISAEGYLEKPFELREVLDAVERLSTSQSAPADRASTVDPPD